MSREQQWAEALKTKATEAETKPENMIDPSCDWVEIVDPEHVLRRGIDWVRFNSNDIWTKVKGLDGAVVRNHLGSQFRCLRRDHPDYQKTEALKTDAVKQKPPLGVMPRKIWLENRLEELRAAISRYEAENRKVAVEWRIEEATISRELIDQPQPPQQPLRWVENTKPDKPGIWACKLDGGRGHIHAVEADEVGAFHLATRCYLGPIPEILPPVKKVVQRLWVQFVGSEHKGFDLVKQVWLPESQDVERTDFIRTDRTREVEQ